MDKQELNKTVQFQKHVIGDGEAVEERKHD